MKEAILFDLDGTLLPMDQEVFTKGYFRLLAQKAAPRGYAPQALIDGIWAGTAAMVQNDGTVTNRERFWNAFAMRFGPQAREDETLFDRFYAHEFHKAAACTAPQPEKARQAVGLAHAHAQQVILATNPIFPRVGVEARLQWLGLSLTDFDYVTSYETASFCKPNPAYYREILERQGLTASQCLMIGNDVEEDALAAQQAGIPAYLVVDCLIQRGSDPLPAPSGTFDNLLEALNRL